MILEIQNNGLVMHQLNKQVVLIPLPGVEMDVVISTNRTNELARVKTLSLIEQNVIKCDCLLYVIFKGLWFGLSGQKSNETLVGIVT